MLPKKLNVGQRVTSFPVRSWNALVDGEIRDRAPQRDDRPLPYADARSCVVVRLAWQEETELPPGQVVKLGAALIDPTDDASAPFDGLQFKCSTPDAVDNFVAITQGPIAPMGLGYGFIPQATWAKVNVSDELHEFAIVADAATLLESAVSGRFPILWKQAGTGELWAVIFLGTSGGSSIREGLCTVAIDAGDLAGNTAGSGEVQLYKDDGAGGMETDGDPVLVVNWIPLPFEVGAYMEVDEAFNPMRVREGTCPAAV